MFSDLFNFLYYFSYLLKKYIYIKTVPSAVPWRATSSTRAPSGTRTTGCKTLEEHGFPTPGVHQTACTL